MNPYENVIHYLSMFILALAAFIVMFLLSGCESVVNKGADVNDDAVQAAEFTICNGASIGSIRRAYGDRPQVWESLCADEFMIKE